MKLRVATTADAKDLLEIYRPYVEASAISFELQPPTLSNFEARISETLLKFPYLVCEDENRILGYAYAGPFRTRSAYAWSVESTVYIRNDPTERALAKSSMELF